MVRWLECVSIVANSIPLKKYEAIKIIFIRVDFLTRKTFGLEIILGRGLLFPRIKISGILLLIRDVGGVFLLENNVRRQTGKDPLNGTCGRKN
jgi:hypothetical protein